MFLVVELVLFGLSILRYSGEGSLADRDYRKGAGGQERLGQNCHEEVGTFARLPERNDAKRFPCLRFMMLLGRTVDISCLATAFLAFRPSPGSSHGTP